MSLGRDYIYTSISSKSLISKKDSSLLLSEFFKIVANKSKSCKLNLYNFGTFYRHKSPRRVGRNPKTNELHNIPTRYTIKFSASSKIRKLLN